LTYTSQGILLFDEDYEVRSEPRPWGRYVLVARDGYVEYARKAGFPLKRKPYFQFAPLVAWVQRFVAFVVDLRGQMAVPPDYFVVLSMWQTEHAQLCVFGDGWREPWDAWGFPSTYQCLEPQVQISRPLGLQDTPEGWGRWFAERIANAFGEGEPRCFNHANSKGTRGVPGELPTDRVDF
jgi:hypothetical protein